MKPISFRALLRVVEPYVNSVNLIRASIDAVVRLHSLVLAFE